MQRSRSLDAILVPGVRSAGRKARLRRSVLLRENKVPYLGICLGMQLATIEFARNVAGLEGANSTEFNADTPHPVVALITEWLDREGRVKARRRVRSGRHHAPRRPGLPDLARNAGGFTARWSPSAIVTATKSIMFTFPSWKRGMVISARTPTEELPE